MDGIHDLGGMHGFGRIKIEENEPVFHSNTERRIFALSMAVPLVVPYSDDHLRTEIERIDPSYYLTSGYYEKWLLAVSSILRKRFVISDTELSGGDLSPLPAGLMLSGLAKAEMVEAIISAGASQERTSVSAPSPRFIDKDMITTVSILPYGHTRLPRYARTRVGIIEKCLGRFIFADSHSAYMQEDPQWLYSVSFKATDLWGADASAKDTLRLDLWESYLMPMDVK
jgi:nitrile hydratase subunit beta